MHLDQYNFITFVFLAVMSPEKNLSIKEAFFIFFSKKKTFFCNPFIKYKYTSRLQKVLGAKSFRTRSVAEYYCEAFLFSKPARARRLNKIKLQSYWIFVQGEVKNCTRTG